MKNFGPERLKMAATSYGMSAPYHFDSNVGLVFHVQDVERKWLEDVAHRVLSYATDATWLRGKGMVYSEKRERAAHATAYDHTKGKGLGVSVFLKGGSVVLEISESLEYGKGESKTFKISLQTATPASIAANYAGYGTDLLDAMESAEDF